MGKRRKSRTWIWSVAGVLATLILGFATNLLSADLQEAVKSYKFWVWAALIVALIIRMGLAIWGKRKGLGEQSSNAIKSTIVEAESIDGSNFSIGNQSIQLSNPQTVHDVAGGNITYINNSYGMPQNQSSANSLHQIPLPPRDFKGRQAELDELKHKVEADGVTILNIRGAGGIGKSALVYKLAESLNSRYPDAQIYIDLKGTQEEPVKWQEAMAHVIQSWDINAKVTDNESALQGLYRSALDGKRVLLFFDNAKDRCQIESLISVHDSCLTLVTSRNHFTLSGCYGKHLDEMDPDDACDMVQQIAGSLSRDEAGKLAKVCGYMPQALKTAAGSLAESPNITFAQFMDRLSDRTKRLGLVEGTFDVSYELMETGTQKLWRLLGVFPGTFDDAGAAAVWGMDEDETRDVLTKLISRSMVEWEGKTSRYRLHDLARDFAQSKLLQEELDEASFKHAAHYAKVAEKANYTLLKGGESYLVGLVMFDQERHNIESCWNWVQSRWEEDDVAANLCIAYALKCGHILSLRLHAYMLRDWMDIARRSANKAKDRSSEAGALCNLGNAYRYLGNYSRAIECYGQSLDIAREIGNRMSEGNSLCNLGNAYTSLGNYSRAIEYYMQSLDIAREIGNRMSEGNSLGNLGNAYSLLGNYNRAIEYHRQSLYISREIGDNRSEGNSLGNLGNIYNALGDHKCAIEYHEKSLDIARKIGDRRGEGSSLGNLGCDYQFLGEYKRAIEYYGKSLAIARETCDRRSEGNRLLNRSLAQRDCGRQKEALVDAKAALRIFEELDLPHVERARNMIAELEGMTQVTTT